MNNEIVKDQWIELAADEVRQAWDTAPLVLQGVKWDNPTVAQWEGGESWDMVSVRVEVNEAEEMFFFPEKPYQYWRVSVPS